MNKDDRIAAFKRSGCTALIAEIARLHGEYGSHDLKYKGCDDWYAYHYYKLRNKRISISISGGEFILRRRRRFWKYWGTIIIVLKIHSSDNGTYGNAKWGIIKYSTAKDMVYLEDAIGLYKKAIEERRERNVIMADRITVEADLLTDSAEIIHIVREL